MKRCKFNSILKKPVMCDGCKALYADVNSYNDHLLFCVPLKDLRELSNPVGR